MRNGIAQQRAQLRAIQAQLGRDEGDATSLRSLANALAANLDAALSAITAIDNLPTRRGIDMLTGSASFAGVEHGDIEHNVSQLARNLRRLPNVSSTS